ncbi:hypothetical protein ABD91_00725 [Lysinibacillus sphaericus]|uniref:hypothetical protein n=1 Tax=Lysinibacillus sphaericus TaxID=1421 RepID=UPI0018CE033E|nr:hypothetical protein [Lysinibacillus sphaericus]MBG9689451.1 hypothetical protein [Lysinibacillus sphaericus]
MSKIAIVDADKSLKESVDKLSRALMELYKNEDTNPINLGITMEEFVEMNEAMNTKSEKKSSGFLEGKKMNKILGKRK